MTAIKLLGWIVAVLGLAVVLGNLSIAVYRRGSLIPVIGMVLICVSLAVLGAKGWWWLLILADIGGIYPCSSLESFTGQACTGLQPIAAGTKPVMVQLETYPIPDGVYLA